MNTQLTNRYILPRRPLSIICGYKPNKYIQSAKRIGYTPLSLIFRQNKEKNLFAQRPINYIHRHGHNIVIAPRLNLILQWAKQIKSIFRTDRTKQNTSKFNKTEYSKFNRAEYSNSASFFSQILNNHKYQTKYLVNIQSQNNRNFRRNEKNHSLFPIRQLWQHTRENADIRLNSRMVCQFRKSLAHHVELLTFKSKSNQHLSDDKNSFIGLKKSKNVSPADVAYRSEKSVEKSELKAQQIPTMPMSNQVPNINIDRLADDVIKKINKKIQIQRERRGLF